VSNYNETALRTSVAGRTTGLLKLCSEAELDFLLQTKDKEGFNSLHSAAWWRDPEAIRSTLRGVRERDWRGEREQEEWRNSLDDGGLTALHLAIAFPSEDVDGREEAGAEVVHMLLCPLEGGAEEKRGGENRKRHPDEQEDQGADQQGGEEERRRKERMYLGGLDPNKKCGKRSMSAGR
jgi:hypothetical protein